MMKLMKCRFLMLLCVLGVAGCHSDSHLATGINSALLNSTATYPTVAVTFQGKVTCTGCDGSAGMTVVVSSAASGLVTNGFYENVGGYKLMSTAHALDTLTIRVAVTKTSTVVGKTVSVPVPEAGGVIQQDFEF